MKIKSEKQKNFRRKLIKYFKKIYRKYLIR